MWIKRNISRKILNLVQKRPAILLTGARQTGKSSLLRKLFPEADYVTLDRPVVANEAESNPSQFLARFKNQVIIDEVQYAPSLFRALKTVIDEDRETPGRWILTGSQVFSLMKGVSESLAGRISILNLDTLRAQELRNEGLDIRDYMWKGGYPELWKDPELDPQQFFNDYIATYLERDLKTILDVGNLRTFDQFVRTLALRAGSLLNLSDLARTVGVSATTIKSWISALEASHIVTTIYPWFSNQGKRLSKTPKIFFNDHGLLANLVGIRSEEHRQGSPFLGSLFENLVFCELKFLMESQGLNRNIFFWRDKYQAEIDFVLEDGFQLTLVEVKHSESPHVPIPSIEKFQSELSKDYAVRKVIACRVEGTSLVHHHDYQLWNPLSWSLFSK